jgi:hypothetical protein
MHFRSHDLPDLSKLDLKSASVQQPLFMEPLPFPCRPERSRGTCGSAALSWKRGILYSNKIVISTGAYPDFLPRSAGHGRVCGFR